MKEKEFSKLGQDLLKKLEGLRLKSYPDSGGILTIGYGHTGTVNGKPIINGMTITEAMAEELLVQDFTPMVKACNKLLQVELTQNQFDAIVIFAFNIGINAFKKSSVLRYLNDGKGMNDVAYRISLYNKVTKPNGEKVIVNGLVKRRNAEIRVLLDGDYRHV